MIKITKLGEAGYEHALLGLSLNKHQPVDKMPAVLNKLCPSALGEAKVLEMISVWLDIKAPRYWWSQFDTYRIGVSKSSESTMHTLGKKHLTQEDFSDGLPEDMLNYINVTIDKLKIGFSSLTYLKSLIPEGFMQRRIVCTNYKTLRGILLQRRAHKLEEWKSFCRQIIKQTDHPELLIIGTKEDKKNDKVKG